MPLTDANAGPVITARNNFRSAAITFVTSTLPPIAQTLHDTILATDPMHPMLAAPEDAQFYAHCVVYMRTLIARGLYAGAPLPHR
jgi:hypothetical protein